MSHCSDNIRERIQLPYCMIVAVGSGMLPVGKVEELVAVDRSACFERFAQVADGRLEEVPVDIKGPADTVDPQSLEQP